MRHRHVLGIVLGCQLLLCIPMLGAAAEMPAALYELYKSALQFPMATEVSAELPPMVDAVNLSHAANSNNADNSVNPPANADESTDEVRSKMKSRPAQRLRSPWLQFNRQQQEPQRQEAPIWRNANAPRQQDRKCSIPISHMIHGICRSVNAPFGREACVSGDHVDIANADCISN